MGGRVEGWGAELLPHHQGCRYRKLEAALSCPRTVPGTTVLFENSCGLLVDKSSQTLPLAF